MALQGQGFLAIWNDVVPAEEAEWLRWHTIEHIPERVDVPGFLNGRRYVDWNLGHHRFFTLYSGEDLATFGSAPYIERLNNPSPWTTRMMPHFRNFLRGACRVVASTGRGIGGAMATVRVSIGDRAHASDTASATAFLEQFGRYDGVLGAHLGLADVDVTGVPTRERDLRGTAREPVFEGVVLVEALGRRALTSALADMPEAIRKSPLNLTPNGVAIYDLSLYLDKRTT